MNQPHLLRKTTLDTALSDVQIEVKPKADSAKNLRDDFAMAALDHASTIYAKMTVAELDRLMGRKNYTKDAAVARLAYNMADAMLEARQA